MAQTATLERKPRQAPPVGSSGSRKMRALTIPRRSDLPGSDANLDLKTLGGRLAYARLREEMTQDDLAKAIDKVRATVVAYERNQIMPPLPIVEALAKKLKVSPSFLAFGEHGVKAAGGTNAAESTINVDEITYGRDGSFVSGTFAIPREVAEGYVDELKDLKVYVLGHNAEAFGLRSGDRLFADTSVRALSNEFDTYVIEVNGGMEIVRVSPSFTKSNLAIVEGPRGDKVETKVRDLKIAGAVVSTLRSQ